MNIKTTLIVLILSFAGCVQPKVLQHDVNMAAKSAEQFAALTFVTNDFQKGHSLLPEKYQKELPLREFIKVIEGMHPNGYPTQVKATEFEPIPGQAAVRIFLEGKNKREMFYYHFIMEGEKQNGYTIKGMYRGKTKYQPSKLRRKLGL